MVHPLVSQLRFTRSEFERGLEGLSDEDARKRLMPMNCISWNIGHLAAQEQRYWLHRGQGIVLEPELNTLYAYGAPASTPRLDEVLAMWRKITTASDPWLDELTTQKLSEIVATNSQGTIISYGNLLRRITYHYWFHNGENQAIRQMFQHGKLPDFVGDIDEEAPYVPE
ncbi:MAG: DinB family protein [Chloroflexia bacterium]